MDLNLYKVDHDEMKEFEENLKKSGYEKIALEKKFEKTDYIMYIEKKETKMLSWLEQLGQIFTEFSINKFRKDNINAIIILKLEKYNLCLSFGQSHHKIDKYCDLNFGLDFAERGMKEIKLKQSFYINSYKNKAVIDYTRESESVRELGESIQLIQGSTATEKIGKKISCGSSVRFSVSLKNEDKIEDINELNDFFKTVIETYNGKPRMDIPRVSYLKKKDKKIEELNVKFLNEISKKSKSDQFEVLLDSFYEKAAGIYFNFSDLEYKIQKTNETIKEMSQLIEDEIFEIIYENNKEVKKLNLCIYKDETFLFSIKLLDIFSYIYYDKNDQKYYLLINGRWVEFEESFLDEVNRGVNNIEYFIDDSYNIEEYIGEEMYNMKISLENNLMLLDRKLFKGIEIGDLKTNNNELIHVKKHKNFSDLIYAIQQSMLSASIISDRNLHEKLKEKYKIPFTNEKFSQSLLFLFEKGYFERNLKKEKNFSKIKSIIFKLRLLSWHNFMKEKDLIHKVYIQYYEK